MDRETILREIEENFNSVIQWARFFDYERASYYSSKAEGLIELLEIEDCGSVGGYDNKNPNDKVCDNLLYNRFITLCKKNKKNKYPYSKHNSAFFTEKE